MRRGLFCLLVGILLVWPCGGFAFKGPGGLAEIKLYRGEFEETVNETALYVDYVCTGTVNVWNTRTKLQIRVVPNQGLTEDDEMELWKVKTVHAYVGADPVPVDAVGTPLVEQFPYVVTYGDPSDIYSLVLDLEADLGFRWGAPYEDLRRQNICVHAVLVKLDFQTGQLMEKKDVYTFDPEFEVAMAADEWEHDLIEIGQGRLKKSHQVKKGQAVRNRVRIMRGVLNQALLSHAGSTVYAMAHPRRAHFIDSPVAGLTVKTPTYEGQTDDSGGFDYFPGERAELFIGDVYLGNALVDHKISPADVFEGGDMDDNRVINLAWLLQSLDADGDPSGGISITESVVKAFETVINDKELADVDFSNDSEVESVIEATVAEGSGYADLNLVKVSREEAQGHLGKSIGSTMFRKNVSKTPLMASAKAKLNVMGVWFPALKANGEPAAYLDSDGNTVTGIPYYDENGDLIRTATEAKPVVAVYTDEIDGYGAADVFAAVSRDDGHTWKRKNISRMADRSSFTLANGEAYYGHCKKPVFQVKGNKILIAWTSKFAKGGKPRYAIRSCPDEDGDGVADECETCTGSGENEKCGPDYPYDDPYEVDDIWGVSGPQRSVDYTEQGYPEVGEVPYSAIWTCRGVIVTQAEINKGGWWADRQVGDIVWYKPERMTSGRRDANQVFMGAADGAGFAITWQEDPKGLRPGEAKGPGPGWGGATANHKTDIWYSYITWKDHATVDENFVAGGDPEHPVQYDEETGEEIAWTNRPKALVPMSLPVRISDNDSVNTNNTTLLDADGNPIAAVSAGAIVYNAANLTRCVKFVGGATIVTPDDPAASTADYAVLRAVPSTHQATMNCTQCHVPFGMTSVNDAPTQGAPIPLVVLDAETDSYLGGFTNSDCVSCHYGHVVPRDRVIAVTPGLTDEGKCDECEAKGGIWKDGTQEGGEIIEAYYPYAPYPYIAPDPDDTRDGSHRYITEVPGLWTYENAFSPDRIGLYTKTNYQGQERTVAVTTDGRLLDGNTAATRPNLFMQTYTKSDGTKSAWAIMAYEETKGMGSGPSETTGTGEQPQDGSGYDPYETVPDEGKNAIYHSFDFTQPDLVSGGTILNLPETDDNGNSVYVEEPQYLGSDPVYDDDGNIIGYDPINNPDYVVDGDNAILDWKGDKQLAYENARRPRFIIQSKASAFGGTKTLSDGTTAFKQPNNSGTVLIVLYKEGEEGAGRPSDIMMRRCVVGSDQKGNPWHPDNFLPGAQNVSTVMPGTTWINPDRSEDAKGDGTKVCDWTQPEECLTWKSGVNPYEDARAHRGAIRGDFVILGYSYCPNWAASRKAHDKYDFYIRRSFDGGAAGLPIRITTVRSPTSTTSSIPRVYPVRSWTKRATMSPNRPSTTPLKRPISLASTSGPQRVPDQEQQSQRHRAAHRGRSRHHKRSNHWVACVRRRQTEPQLLLPGLRHLHQPARCGEASRGSLPQLLPRPRQQSGRGNLGGEPRQ
ncbi:choice-of-anchor O protein [Desulfosarcina cetonica]|uniref:choice-of-anchor O protein n=1 Tax=Desulfosarcina cetonica TaxID=90730 RepID=UPI0012EE99DC|nr:choice-of-anchor O protein [Desulfosarcina cetonica]